MFRVTGVSPYLVADRLSVVVDLFIQQLKQSRRIELEVLHIWLLGRSRCLQNKVQSSNVSEIHGRMPTTAQIIQLYKGAPGY